MERKVYEFDGPIVAVPEKGGAYVAFPWDIRSEFGRGRVKVHAAFDGVPCQGSLVNMGIKLHALSSAPRWMQKVRA